MGILNLFKMIYYRYHRVAYTVYYLLNTEYSYRSLFLTFLTYQFSSGNVYKENIEFLYRELSLNFNYLFSFFILSYSLSQLIDLALHLELD